MIGIKSEALLLLRKFITSKTTSLTIRNICHSTVLNDITADKQYECTPTIKKNVKKKKQLSSTVDEICKYFDGAGFDFTKHVHELPTRIVSSRKSIPDHLYLVDNNVADTIVGLIKDDLLVDPRKIIEINAGVGLITERLLAAGIPRVTIMELNAKFIKILADLQARYRDRIIIREADVLNLWKIAYQDKQDNGERVDKLFTEFPYMEWGDEPGLKIIGVTTNGNFIKHMILDVVRRCGLVSYGRPCFYLSLPPSVWMRLTANNKSSMSEYRNTSVLFQLLFDYKMLGVVPRKAYLPWTPVYPPKKPSVKTKKRTLDKDDMYLVKIEGKKNLFTEIIDKKQIEALWYFVNHHLLARSAKVISHMERWQPGCGPKLIMELDLDVFTQFGDLNPHEILQLFKAFTSWDGYQNSFLQSMENSPQKMEQLLF